MKKNDVTVIIPNYNGIKFLDKCINALKLQTYKNFDVLVVDNASKDGSIEWLKENNIESIFLEENLGFAGGVNVGLRKCDSEFVILLNNDTEVFPDFVEELLKAIKKSKKIFSVNPMMLQMNNKELMDDAGDGICILGWAFQIGVGEKKRNYKKSREIFSACAGASIYRKSVLDKIGYFDELHFAYLEDIDLGYRARLFGYKNVYEPRARVYHYGSGTSGSKYNSFKVKLAARNNIYLHYKNQCTLQLIINALFLLLGIIIKAIFFYRKGFLSDYIYGCKEGMIKCIDCKRVDSSKVSVLRYVAVEVQMLAGMFEYVLHFINRRLGR